MNKKLLNLKSLFHSLNTLVFLSLSTSVFSQINSSVLDINSASVIITNEGTQFIDYNNSGSGYEIPKGSNIHPIFATQFWFAGKKADGEIRTVIGGSPTEGTDVFKGPYSSTNSYLDPNYAINWNSSIFEICQSEIDAFKQWWYYLNIGASGTAPDMPNDETMYKINHWPAQGNGLGIANYLAPFFDFNLDGNYNPVDGDYPIIKGCCAVYIIQNDVANTHTYSGTESIGLEMHYMFYQYQTWDYLNDVTFVDVMTINKGNTNYEEFTHGIMMDADIGNGSDDYIGCDSTLNLMMFYNADNFDENGYLTNPPAIGVVSLENDISSFSPLNSATNTLERWNVLNGKNSNGSDWLNQNGQPTNFVYSGNPNDVSGWNEASASNPSGDRRGLITSMDGSFNIGDTLLESYAILFSNSGTNLQNAENLLSLAGEVKTFYTDQSDVPCSSNGTWGIKEIDTPVFSLIPNPSTGKFTVNNAQNLEMKVEVIDFSGKMIYSSNQVSSTSSIDLTDKPKGVYFVSIFTAKEKVFKKMVIQ